DPYGAAPLRMRLYYSGIAIARMLDQLQPGWHDAIFAPDATLTSLAQKALAATRPELDAALAGTRNTPARGELEKQKIQLERDGRAATEAMADGVRNAPSRLLLEYAAGSPGDVDLVYTPFGVMRISQDETLYTQIPITVTIRGRTRLQQDHAAPLLHDR